MGRVCALGVGEMRTRMMNRCEDYRKGRKVLMTVAVLTLLLTGSSQNMARAANQPKRLTPHQRKELEQRASELHNAGENLSDAGEIAPRWRR